MSYNKQKKPFCKVCQDAGKPESEYTSHYVRSLPDKQGRTTVTCPTLLATECRYCYKLGHTTKFCNVLASNKKAEEKAYSQAKYREKIEKVEAKTPVRKLKPTFAVLAESSDSDVETKEVSKPTETIIEEYPTLGAPVAVQSEAPAITGWAAVAAKTTTQYQNEKYEQQLIEKSIKRVSIPPVLKKPIVVQKKRWADWTDTEDEEEDEEEEEEQKYTYGKASDMEWEEIEEHGDW
jgi:hypothetical protein